MTDDNQLSSGQRNYGTTPVSVFPSLVAEVGKVMTLSERGRKVAQTLYEPDNMTLDEFLSMADDYKDVIDEIRRSRDEGKIRSIKKYKLPCACIAATLNFRSDSFPLNRKIDRYNGLMVINIDKLEDPEEVKNELAALPYVFYISLSACGHGLFVIIPIATKDYHEHEYFFKEIQHELEERGIYVDDTGCDLSKIVLTSIDKKAYRNDNCIEFRPFVPINQNNSQYGREDISGRSADLYATPQVLRFQKCQRMDEGCSETSDAAKAVWRTVVRE